MHCFSRVKPNTADFCQENIEALDTIIGLPDDLDGTAQKTPG